MAPADDAVTEVAGRTARDLDAVRPAQVQQAVALPEQAAGRLVVAQAALINTLQICSAVWHALDPAHL